MFKCEDCGAVFEEPAVSREYHGLEYGYEERGHCPNCGSDDYTNSKVCDICGEPAWGSDYCEDCKEKAKEFLKIDFGYFESTSVEDLLDLFNEALDDLYVEERRRK